MIKMQPLKQQHLNAINEFIQTEDTSGGSFNKRTGERVALPHDVYLLSLSDILDITHATAGKANTRAVGITGTNNIVSLFDLADVDDSRSVVTSIFNDEKYLKGVTEALQKAIDTSTNIPEEAELRALRINALYFEAVWLHFTDSSNDIYIPVKAFEPIQKLQKYSANQLYDLLHQQATKLSSFERDEAIAP
jgi:hypothetical protein